MRPLVFKAVYLTKQNVDSDKNPCSNFGPTTLGGTSIYPFPIL